MIRIQTDGPVGARFEAWRTKAEKARSEMVREYEEKGTPPDPNRYQKIWKELKEIFLLDTFQGKCAFCEANLQLANFPPDVEHYRPKRGVTVAGKSIDHPGYFWLACEWYNLLLVCRNCNSAHSDLVAGRRNRHPGKAKEFPINGERICKPSDDPATWAEELESEKPLLLHPYLDDPEQHIAFSSLGVPYAKNGSERGKATIEACHLDRESLCEARRALADDFVKKRLYSLMEGQRKSLHDAGDPFSAWLKEAFPILLSKKLAPDGLKVTRASAE